MDFGGNKTPVEVIKESAFEETYFRSIYSGVTKEPYGWFQWYFRYWLGRRSEDDERQINRWKKIVSRFRGKLVKVIKDSGSEFDDYSISPKIRQILLHWGYELTEKDFFNELTN